MAAFTRNDLFPMEVAKLIEEEISRLAEIMSFGNHETIEDYKFSAGKIAGLRQCLEFLEEAAVSVNKKLS